MGKLRLRLDLPLHNLDATKVKGEFTMAGARLERDGGWVPLEDVYGTLSFTEGSIQGQDIKVRVLGEPGRINLASEKDGHVRARYEGRIQAKALGELLPAAFSRYVSGHAIFRAVADMHQQAVQYSIESDLVGLGIQLPPPFGKTANQTRRLVVRGNPEKDARASLLRAQYGDLLAVGITHPGTPAARIGVPLGTGDPLFPDRAGIKIHGALQKLDLDAWQGVWEQESRGDGGQSLPIPEINLSFNEVKIYNRHFHETNVHASPVPHGWRLVLSGHEVQGEAIYDEPGGLPGKRLVGRFKKFRLPLTTTDTPAPAGSTTPMELPRLIDISAESFSYAGYELGTVDTTLSAEGNGLRIDNLSLNAPEARLEGSGWLSASSRRATELSLKLEAKDTGRMLNRLGIPDGIQGGATSISGNINWMGRFEDFQKANLNGRLKVDMKKGRFTRMDPRVGRLLGVLSRQSLPRRITLDFGDVFSSGFAFDSIAGDVHIERGVLYLVANLGFLTTNTELDTLTTTGTGVMLWANIPLLFLFGWQAMKSHRDYVRRLESGEMQPTARRSLTDLLEGKDVE